jgi:hypothetical protein
MVTNREKTAGTLMAVGRDFVTRIVTKRYKPLQNVKILYFTSVTARYRQNAEFSRKSKNH